MRRLSKEIKCNYSTYMSFNRTSFLNVTLKGVPSFKVNCRVKGSMLRNVPSILAPECNKTDIFKPKNSSAIVY